MKPRVPLLLLAGMLSGAGSLAFAADAPATSPEALKFFENEIRPLLANHCFECHGEKKQKSGLRLDHIADILRGGDTGPALVRGEPEKSLLIEAVRYGNEDLQMPPKEKGRLAPEEVALLEKWIALGAPWPAEAPSRVARDAQGFTEEDRRFWAFQPIAKPTPPASAGAGWARNDLDRFVAAKHAELGLTPAPEADRTEFARRVYFDLHGLPPTAAQLQAFVSDQRPDAYERLVDELLASPRYGERWAQHWLDVVRYAESDGYKSDAYRPNAWPYRDYVIASLNADKPYDRFVREQLAGDELAPSDPAVLVATGYLRAPIYEYNQRDVRGQADFILTDLTDNAGEAFLGLSFGCARCHDHKFDPILQKDYFALRAFFAPVVWRSDLPLASADEQKRYAAQRAEWERATADIRAQIDAIIGPAIDKVVKGAHDKFAEDYQAMLDKPAAERDPQERVIASLAQRQLDYEREIFDPGKSLKTAADKTRYRELEAELRKFDKLKPVAPQAAFVATDGGRDAPPVKLKNRTGERAIAPGFMTLLAPEAPAIAPLENSTGRRSALAAWITRPENPLTARVIVNRVWQHHFGRGLVATPNDFGRLGSRPSHPELLDWLASRFVAQGWSLKQLHRDLVLSATYRQTARVPVSEKAALVDPTNVFLWRFSPARLDAEQARDAMLAASGELDLSAGGAPQDAIASPRRAIYTIKKRNNPAEFLRTFDAPAGFTSAPERMETATPLQALFLMNGDWVASRARKFASRAPTVDAAWQIALGRAPTPVESGFAEKFLAKRIAADEAAPPPAALELTPGEPGRFRENTPHERVLARTAPREGDEFTVEAIVELESVDAAAAVRVIASRWNGEKNSLEAHGWSLGVTGKKSAHKPNNLIMQFVGEDENDSTAYEVVPSGLTLELHTPYRVSAAVSTTNHAVVFQVQKLGDPAAERRRATAKLSLVGKFALGQSSPVIGGLFRRSPHQFDGRIDAVRITPGTVPDESWTADLARPPAAGTLVWSAKQESDEAFAWSGGAALAEGADRRLRAMTDLCHVLLNSNEFLFLH